MGQVVAPSLAVVLITGRRSTLPFEERTFLKPMTSVRTFVDAFEDLWKGWSSNVAKVPVPFSMTLSRNACRADVCAPVSILTFIDFGENSESSIHSRHPMVSSVFFRLATPRHYTVVRSQRVGTLAAQLTAASV